jgi:broad specificity phosphatase PhoE
MNAPARTIVHLMRHGEVHNPEGVLYGRLPGYQLSELGREMADTVAAHLADHDIGTTSRSRRTPASSRRATTSRG